MGKYNTLIVSNQDSKVSLCFFASLFLQFFVFLFSLLFYFLFLFWFFWFFFFFVKNGVIGLFRWGQGERRGG